MPHADDAPCGAAGRPCKDNEPRIKPASGDESGLAVVLAIICASEMQPSEHFVSAQHVEAALMQSPLALGWIACDAHAINVSTKKPAVKYEIQG